MLSGAGAVRQGFPPHPSDSMSASHSRHHVGAPKRRYNLLIRHSCISPLTHLSLTFNRMNAFGASPIGRTNTCSPPDPLSGTSVQLPGSKVSLHCAP